MKIVAFLLKRERETNLFATKTSRIWFRRAAMHVRAILDIADYVEIFTVCRCRRPRLFFLSSLLSVEGCRNIFVLDLCPAVSHQTSLAAVRVVYCCVS